LKKTDYSQGGGVDPIFSSQYLSFVSGLQIFAALYVISQFNYLLFHSFAEGFSIVIAFGIFMVVSQSRPNVDVSYFTYAGTACLFIAPLELLHTISFTGMNVIIGYHLDMPIQLWLATRMVQAFALLTGLFFLSRRLRIWQVFIPYFILTGIILLSVFYWRNFPVCLEGENLPTAFARGVDWLIIGMLICALFVVIYRRGKFDANSFRTVFLSILTLLISNFLFTLKLHLEQFEIFYHVSAYFFRILSFYLFYRAAIDNCLEKPFDEVLADLQRKDRSLTESQLLAGLGNYEQDLETGGWYWSTGLYKLFGYDNDDLPPNNGRFWEMIHPDDLETFSTNFRDLLARHQPIALDFRVVTKSGEIRDMQVIGAGVYDSEGTPISHYGTIQDVTERNKTRKALEQAYGAMEQRVEERSLELEQVYEQLLHAGKLSAIGKLSASIAHEFNNPLFGVINVLSGIRRRVKMEAPDAELLEMALNECSRMKNLIRDLQDFNRPSSGQLAPMDLHQTIDSLLLLSKKDLKSRNIEISKEYDQRIPHIKAVADQIKQVLLNLLNNAADACEGGGTIRIRTELGEAGKVVIQVIDNGKGIEPENLQKIFAPFFTTKPAIKGTGLGLSVSHGIIKRHGGTIAVESEPNKGTTFTVNLLIEGELHEEKINSGS
jgi:PAS domain S-box-containing protein